MSAVSAAFAPAVVRRGHRAGGRAAAVTARAALPVSNASQQQQQQREMIEVKCLSSRRELLAGAAAAAAALGSPGAARAIDVGATAPGFTLPATGGGSVALADVVKANKYTVLYFYNQDFSQAGEALSLRPFPLFALDAPPLRSRVLSTKNHDETRHWVTL